ncbi:nucleotidyltransferase domain-containing protein [Chrysiogenes arsenatis]|nr:nucleotidyltransferase domain-containing protein [Chrysiogenes arsenatis]
MKKRKNMINIEKIKLEIVERLKPLKPDKIILFGSYAYGTPTEHSDIDLF